jgi:AcrR family transcriptional regulator
MENAETDLLLDTATRLFAQLGYDGTSLRLIADTAGVDAAAADESFGGKTGLYRKVMLRAYEAEQDALLAAAASFSPTRQGVVDLVDAYLDFHVAHPHISALWMQRWMGDAADIPELEDRTRSLSTAMSRTVQDVTAPGVDVEYLIWTFVWCVHGFLHGGIQHPGAETYHARGEPLSPKALKRFRAYLHTLATRLTVPQDGDDAPEETS